MIEPRSNYYNFKLKTESCRIHYLDWGSVDQPVLFCAHGLTRNGRDFDYLARELCGEYRVIAVDYPGRNLSEWLQDKQGYIIPNYVEISLGLLNELDLNTVNWLGTSMGGLVGMIMGAYYPQRLNTLIINDVGPEIPSEAAQRITDYLSMDLQFNSVDEFEQHLRLIYAPFGELEDQHWQHLTKHSHFIDRSGKVRSNYDPGIVVPFKENPALDADLWDIWSADTNTHISASW